MVQFETNTKRGTRTVEITFSDGSIAFGFSRASYKLSGHLNSTQMAKLKSRLRALMGEDNMPSMAVINRMGEAELRALLKQNKPMPMSDLMNHIRRVAEGNTSIQEFVDHF